MSKENLRAEGSYAAIGVIRDIIESDFEGEILISKKEVIDILEDSQLGIVEFFHMDREDLELRLNQDEIDEALKEII